MGNIPLGALAVFMLTGCATITTGRSRVDDEVVGRSERLKKRGGVLATVTQTGPRLEVRATASCDLIEEEEVVRVTRRERKNETPGTDWRVGFVGAALAGTGIGIEIDSRK